MITSSQMREREEKSGIAKVLLMERAGKEMADIIRERFDLKGKRILLACYHGNNGGDGFVIARHLADHAEVDVLFLGDESKFKDEARLNFKRIENDPRIQILALESVDFSDYGIIIDAIFGIGMKGAITEPLASIINNLNRSKAIKIAVDVPSGIDCDSGKKENAFIEPDMILTVHDIKEGLENYRDKTVIIDIGL